MKERVNEGASLLLQCARMEVAIHVDAAERAFNRIDHAVLIAIQFLEVIVREVRILGVWDACLSGIRAWIITL